MNFFFFVGCLRYPFAHVRFALHVIYFPNLRYVFISLDIKENDHGQVCNGITKNHSVTKHTVSRSITV